MRDVCENQSRSSECESVWIPVEQTVPFGEALDLVAFSGVVVF
jgi:hypothetical protein